MQNTWETVIGLEVHTQLATKTKLFSRAATAYGAAPNTQACAVDLALPGTLPVINEGVVQMALKLGLALDAEIFQHSVFARKNYFYPDLPKGYQISQYEHPIIGKGHLDIICEDGHEKRIGITRAHLEEDAGKSLHEDFHGFSGIDLNRAGTPLLEIVSEPDIRNAKEAVSYLKTLHNLVRYLEISDGNMQEGSFRCDVNISVRRVGQEAFGTRAEIKNVNSFRFVERAIAYEVSRQIHLLESGGTVVQETRLYDPVKNETRSLRGKEDAHDYRYFPDPDLLPLAVSEAEIAQAKADLPELPHQKRQRFIDALGLSDYDANVLVANKSLADYFESVNDITKSPKHTVNWVTGELLGYLNKHGQDIDASPISPEALAKLILRICDNTISNRGAKDIFEAMWDTGKSADVLIEEKGLKQISDEGALGDILSTIISDHPDQLAQYRSGKEKLFGFFVGQAMKATQGRANPKQVNDMLSALLKAEES